MAQRDHLPAAGGTSAQVVVHDPQGDRLPQADLTATGERLAALDHVGTVSAPRLSDDGDTALYYLTYDVPVTDPDLVKEKSVDPLEDAVQPLRDDGLQVELGGELPNSVTESAECFASAASMTRMASRGKCGSSGQS